jgi:PKD repeat protein
MKILIALLLFAGSLVIFIIGAGCENTEALDGCDNCEGSNMTVPECSFTADKTTVYPGDWVNFSYTGSDNVEMFTWQFSGSTTTRSNKRFVTCIYPNVGVYDVWLRAENCCYGDAESKLGYIHVIPYDSSKMNKPTSVNIEFKNSNPLFAGVSPN